MNKVKITLHCTALTEMGEEIYPFQEIDLYLEVLLGLSITNQEIYLESLCKDFKDKLFNDNSIIALSEIEIIATAEEPTIELEGNEFSPRLRGLYGLIN